MRRALLLAGALSLGACSLPTGDFVTYPADAPELANASLVDGVWESGPAAGAEWLPYPGQVTLDVEHGLGRLPRTILVYVSFDREGREAALASGDLARVVDVGPTTIDVRNGTNAQLFARIVLE